MQQSKPLLTSPAFVPPDNRSEPIVASTHIFQDSFPALGTNNAIGGSATVHAQQCRSMGDTSLMIAPSKAEAAFFQELTIPAVGFPFRGHADSNHDEWFERQNAAYVAQILEDVTNRYDPIYSHMPISGWVGHQVKESRGNPHVYIPHAWEVLSARYFPERDPKPLRFLAEYEMLRSAHVIVTNTRWEAQEIARLYSSLPTEGRNREATSKLLSDDVARHLSDLVMRDSGSPLREAEILAKCVPNPLGVDTELFNPTRRIELRNAHRGEFLHRYNLSEDAFLVGSVGRIHPQKDPIASIEVFHRAFNRLGAPENLYLVLAGPYAKDDQGNPTGYSAEVMRTLKEKHHEIRNRVIFPGSVHADQMNAVLDVRIDTARFETWGLSLQEALASGLPSVILQNPVYEELYANFSIPLHADLDRMAEDIVRFVRSPEDRERCGITCAHAGQYYSWERSVAELQRNVLAQFGVR